MSDRPLTREMIEAGADVIEEWRGVVPSYDLAVMAYSAMIAAKSKRKRNLSQSTSGQN